MCKTVDHCYEGGSKPVVDRYHSGNNLGTGPVLFQYYNVYCVSIYIESTLQIFVNTSSISTGAVNIRGIT